MAPETVSGEDVQHRLDNLEREEGRLWRVALLFLALLATGLAALSWQNIVNLPQHLEAIPIGTVVLCVLFAVYVASKRREIAELKGEVRGMRTRDEAPPSEQQLERLLEAVAASQQGYREMIDSLDTVMLSLSLEGKVLTLNRAAAVLTDLPFADIVGHNLEEFIADPPRADAERGLLRFLQRRHWSGVVRVRFPREDAPRYFDCALHAIEKDGNITGISVLARDVTRERERETRFTELFERLQEGVYFSTPDGKLLDCNLALVQMLGYESKEELLAVPVPQLYDDPEQRAAEMKEMESSPAVRHRELHLRAKDGRRLTCLDSCRAIFDSAGQVVRYQGALIDVTDQHRVADHVQKQEEFLTGLVESFPDLILVIDREGRYKLVSPRVRELLGWEPDELLGRSIVGDETPAALHLQRLLHRLVTGRESYESAEYSTQHRDGTWRTLRATAAPMYDARGEVAGIIASVRDITESKQMEQQLIQNERLAAMGQMIDGFAHELNNPLTAILGVIELLDASQLDADSARRYDMLKQQARRAAEVVQNLLFFSRPAAPGHAPLNLAELVQRSIQLHEHSLKAGGISVDFVPDLSLPPVVGDPHQLMQVFLNLVINAEQAMRGADKRGVLRVRMGRKQDKAWVSFQDEGPGISAEVLPKIFDPFFTTKRPGNGTGLGLSIAMAILKKYGGAIDAQPAPEGGAVFTVMLPAEKAAERALAKPAASK
jgi:PAS domain S-box-containing protein